jgi:hypothetical protein
MDTRAAVEQARAQANQANHNALERLCQVRPAWTDVVTARVALALPDFTLLHAGPPLNDPCQPPAPILSSAVLCCLLEGWAANETEAEQLISSGRVTLGPAQQYGAVTPLAAVISPSTTLVQVTDLNSEQPARHAWSLLGSGAGPQIRFGSRNPAILPRLRWRDNVLAATLAATLRNRPVELNPLALAGIQGGDDLHGRTGSANAALCEQLLPAFPADSPEEVVSMLRGTPLFFLTLWMAACHLMLNAAANAGSDPASTLVVGFAGNGEQFGIRLAGKPLQWFVEPGQPPSGPRIDPDLKARVLPVIGDSGAIDAVGFGAQALGFSPEVSEALQPALPAGWRERPALLIGAHPAFSALDVRCGLDAARVAVCGFAPMAAIAMIDAAGQHGLLGRGIFLPSEDLFKQASAALSAV